jgi:hypothetical protein
VLFVIVQGHLDLKIIIIITSYMYIFLQFGNRVNLNVTQVAYILTPHPLHNPNSNIFMDRISFSFIITWHEVSNRYLRRLTLITISVLKIFGLERGNGMAYSLHYRNQNVYSHDKTCESTAKFICRVTKRARASPESRCRYERPNPICSIIVRLPLCAARWFMQSFSRTPNEAGAFRRVQ